MIETSLVGTEIEKERTSVKGEGCCTEAARWCVMEA